MELRRPRLEDRATILEMVDEFKRAESAMDGGFFRSDMNFENWLQSLQEAEMGLSIPDGFVPYIQLVSFDEAGRALGFLNLRLRLNEALLEHGGHIGYSIRPSERGKGYAKKQLQLGLVEARLKNIKKVLVTCHQTNAASRATILANGGAFEDIRNDTERYWIKND